MTGQSTRSRLYAGILLFLTLLAFALRLTRLGAQSLWYDEGVTAVVAAYDPTTLVRWTADDIQPPLYYLVVSAWGHVAGWSEWSLRFVSAAFGTLLIPLMAALTSALTRRRPAALLAALFTALHPLLLYYSQEARMYTMLVVLGVIATHCAVRMMQGEERGARSTRLLWIGYVLSATAAVYTHYFAVFYLAALIVAVLTQHLLATRNAQHSTRRFLVANAAVALLFLPWIGVLVNRLRVDTSYWEGAFKLGEALYHIAIRFTLGETVLDRAATPWLWIYAAVTVLAVVFMAKDAMRPVSSSTPPALFPILYAVLLFVLPMAAVLTLAWLTPKFNPRYVMLALPGLILLWSTGLAGRDWRWGREAWRTPRSPGHLGVNTTAGIWYSDLWSKMWTNFRRDLLLSNLTRIAGIGVLCAGFVYADANWFFDPAFTKDQWRELTQYVRAQRQPDEAVVLVSGHAWPIWQYYAPDLAAVRLPDIEILDVDAVLDFANTADPLRRGLANRDAAWLVGWQDDIIDPMQVAPLQLARGGAERAVDAQFWGLSLRRFSVDPTQITDEPPIANATAVNFGNAIELIGYTVDADGTLLLYWRQPPHAPRLPDLLMSGETFTQSGLLYADLVDQRPAGYDYPTFRWQPGQVTVGRVAARDWAGDAAAPGNYRLRLGVYDPAEDLAGLDVLADEGTPLGKRVTLDVTLPRPTLSVIGENPTAWPELAPGIFADAQIDPQSAAPGQPVQLSMRWWTAQSLAGRVLELGWQRDDQLVAGEQIEVAPGFPPVKWANEWQMRTLYPLRPPQELEPGDYRLSISLSGGGGSALFLPVKVEADRRSFLVPELALVLDAGYGGQLTLRGLIDALPAQLPPGASLPISLVWQANAPMDADLSVTAQWLDEDGRPVEQMDVALPGGSASWVAGQVVTQPLVLSAPNTPGTYRLIVAVYDAQAAGLPRLRVDGGDALDLGGIEIVR